MSDVFKSTEKVKLSSKYTGRPAIYNFKELKIGESLRLDKNSVKASRLRSAASHYGKRHGKQFSVVTHDEFYEVARVD
jgi:hypothetical protein